MKSEKITHIFLGDHVFLCQKFVRAILKTSCLVHQFVVFVNAENKVKWTSFIDANGFDAKLFLFVPSFSGGGAGGLLLKIRTLLQVVRFSSPRVLSHRRHYNLVFMMAMRAFGRRMSFVCWGDVPQRETRLSRRLDQMLRFRLYKLGVVQIRPEERLFHERCYSGLKMVTMPYLRDNAPVLSLSMKPTTERILLVGNNSWYYDLYDSVLSRIDWNDWDRVICMLNYGNEGAAEKIEVFCRDAKAKYVDKLELWRTSFPIDEYYRRIGACRCYVFPAVTQGGIDLAYNMLLMGKLVVCRGVLYEWFREIGCHVKCLDEIDLKNAESFASLSEREISENREIVTRLTDMSAENARKWDEIYCRL